jgi:hypothetical protein
MEKEKYLMIKFSGDKEELKKQLKSYCALAGKTQNGLVIELIEELLKAQDLNNK